MSTRNSQRVRFLSGLTWIVVVIAGSAAARPMLTPAQFLAPASAPGLVANAAFMPSPDAAAARAPFIGTLSLTETGMTIKPRALAQTVILGRDVTRFPGVSMSFVSVDGDLVPFTQDVIRYGSAGLGRSFWDIIVQPGRVWSEPGDGQWSRAAFPFALVNSLEGETHNGVASFLYTADRVSALRVQIVQQTAPFYVKEHFLAAAVVPAVVDPAPPPNAAAVADAHRAEQRETVAFAPWSVLEARVGAARLAGFDGRMPLRDIVLSGLDYEGTFYLKECVSAAGPLPWCDRARFGVWSATKALANETALLRLAQKFGPEVFDRKLADYVPELQGHAQWRNVRFEDAIDMATGIGSGSLSTSPNDISDGYITADYGAWYEARSVADKVRALVAAGRAYPWGPGKVARYRDEDMFLLGVAMDGFLKSKEGSHADLWSMLEKEVFAPIGIRHAPTNRTIEPDGSRGQPLMAYGYYPTLGDMVRIARLYHADGQYAGRPILYAPRIARLLSPHLVQGLPTGERLAYGETTYSNAFWIAVHRPAADCEIRYPRMIGWGGNVVALLPNGMTGIRLAKSGASSDPADVETAGMAQVALRLAEACR